MQTKMDSKKTGTSSRGIVIDCDEIRILPPTNEDQKFLKSNGKSSCQKKKSNRKGKLHKQLSNASSGKDC